MRKLETFKGHKITNLMLVEEKNSGIMFVNSELEAVSLKDLYQQGYVLNAEMNEIIGGYAVVRLDEKVEKECKTEVDLIELLDAIEYSETPYGFYNEEDKAFVVIKEGKLYVEKYNHDYGFDLESYRALYCRYDLIAWLKGYIKRG